MTETNPQQAPATLPVDTRLTFPPFPQVPEGVIIIPFKQFKERGIQLFATDGDDVERDGLGIPTVELGSQHDTDDCKTETRRKRKAKKVANARQVTTPGVRMEWWEQWMEGEDLRSAQYNPNISSIDKLYEAAAEFRKGRPWPPGTTGLSQNWDQFRLFVGLLSNTPIWTRTDKPARDGDSDNGDDDDDDEFDTEVGEGGSKPNIVASEIPHGPKKFTPRPRARPPYANYGTDPIPVGSDAEVEDLLEEERARKEEKVILFLNDPEERMRVLFSSYMRKQGFIWSDRNLINMPRLVGFFIRFLLRSRVFTEPSEERRLRRSLDVVDLAQKELILTSKVAKAYPDEFSLSCKECWGKRAESYQCISFEPELKESGDNDNGNDGPELDEPKQKKAKIYTDEIQTLNPADTAISAIAKFEEELKAEKIELIKIDDDVPMQDAPKIQIVDDSAVAEDVDPNNNSWGTWDNTNSAPLEETDPWESAASAWDPPRLHSLMYLLGPSALPLTHTPGVVEWSVRRVKSFTPPPAPNTVPKSPITAEEDPDAVDIELERQFAKVVMGPWLGWDKSCDEMPHLAEPRILESSRGPVVQPGDVAPTGDGDAGSAVEANAASASQTDGVKPHDPFNDDITILVDPSVLDILSLGMGIGCTWVQIARAQDFGEGAKKKKKGKGKSKKVTQRYWYADELLLILPSFHT